MTIRTSSALFFAVVLGVGAASAQQDDPDRVTDGEQLVNISGSPTARTMNRFRQAVVGVDGVVNVSGRHEIIFQRAPGATVRWSTIRRAVDGPDYETSPAASVGAPTLGFSLTVDIVFKADRVRPEQGPAIIAAMAAYEFGTLADFSYVSGTTIRVTTAPWSHRNQRGFDVVGILNPVARAIGYRGPARPTYDSFIEDVVFVPSGD